MSSTCLNSILTFSQMSNCNNLYCPLYFLFLYLKTFSYVFRLTICHFTYEFHILVHIPTFFFLKFSCSFVICIILNRMTIKSSYCLNVICSDKGLMLKNYCTVQIDTDKISILRLHACFSLETLTHYILNYFRWRK